MNTVVISSFKHEKDAAIIYSVIKKFNAKVKIMRNQQWEDFFLGKMAAETEKENDIASPKEVIKWFKQYGINY